MQTETTPARAALEAAGYRCYGAQQWPANATLYQRKTHGYALNVYEWPPVWQLPEYRYEVEIAWHDERDAAKVQLYSYAPDELARRLPELERRAMAAIRALVGAESVDGAGYAD
jgi:hypothetical protein